MTNFRELLRQTLTRRGIGDFTEDGRLFCSRGGGQIRGALVKSFVGQDGEGQGFFGVGGDVETRRRKNRDGDEVEVVPRLGAACCAPQERNLVARRVEPLGEDCLRRHRKR